jgi:Ca2+-binding EF-hand superfamily protein
MKNLSLFLLSAGLFALPTVAAAQPGLKDGPEPRTRAELQKVLTEHFEQLDMDRNGVISSAERKAEHDRRQAAMFQRIDGDGDGKLSPSEFAAAREHHAEGAGREGRKGGRMAKLQERREARMKEDLTREQFMSRGLAMFDRVDSNRDGTISEAERAAIRSKMRGRGGKGMMPPPSASAT